VSEDHSYQVTLLPCIQKPRIFSRSPEKVCSVVVALHFLGGTEVVLQQLHMRTHHRTVLLCQPARSVRDGSRRYRRDLVRAGFKRWIYVVFDVPVACGTLELEHQVHRLHRLRREMV